MNVRCFLFVVCLPLTGSCVADSSPWSSFREQVSDAVSMGDRVKLEKLSEDLDSLIGAPEGWADYWSAYLQYRMASVSGLDDASEPSLRACIEKARQAVDATGEDNTLRAESQALLGACHSSLAGTGMRAGMEHGPRATMLRDESLLTAPDNPRVLILAGIQDVWTPVQWGGSPERAERQLRRALGQLDSANSVQPWQPRWGRSDAVGHLALALNRLDRGREARSMLDQARSDGYWNGWLDWVAGQLVPTPSD